MKKLKLWIKEQIENISDQVSEKNLKGRMTDQIIFNELGEKLGSKIAYENVLAEIKKMEKPTLKNDHFLDKMLDDNRKEFKMYELSFKRPKNYFKLDERAQWRIDAKLGILDWKGDNLTKNELKRFHAYYDEN